MQTHRGPDAQGTFVTPDGLLALGNTRLAITDPDSPIDVPLRSTDGSTVISFNGEIYDFAELRRELQGHGATFRYQSDTEVLLEGLRRDGEAFLERIDGMWAFAFYDADARSLLLSRDVMGERHLFFRRSTDELVFASEPQPILADSGDPKDFDFDALVTALRYGSSPPGRSLVEGLHRLRPGHNLRATSGKAPEEYRQRRLHPEKWFDFFAGGPSLDTIVETFENIMLDVTQRRVPPHVPFYLTLSGGLDSALVCTYASNLGRREIDTVYGHSASNADRDRADELNEYDASVFTSERLKTNHNRIEMNSEDCIPVLQRMAEGGFDGMLSTGAAPFQMLALKTRSESRKVMMISDGPDELIGGYPTDLEAWRVDLWRARHPVRYGLRRLSSRPYFGRRALRRLGYGKNVIEPGVSHNPFHFVPRHQSSGEDLLARLVGRTRAAAVQRHYGVVDPAYADILPALDFSQTCALSYAARSLPDMFNLRTDKAFLGASVECRVPFQAPQIAEFLIALPANARFNNDDATKFLSRTIVQRHIGPQVANRRKHGFSVPLFETPAVRKAMRFEEVIRGSRLFDDLPFTKGTKDLVFTPSFVKLVWPFYVLARTYERMRTAQFAAATATGASGAP